MSSCFSILSISTIRTTSFRDLSFTLPHNKMNKTLNQLKKENHEQKKLIRNYHNDNYENNIYNIKIQNNFKQKFCCKYCSNKKFKSKYYLDKHIQRRHPDTYEVSPHLESLEQVKLKLKLLYILQKALEKY